ncbi:hypothetical protein GDI0255 [Gluconacetobacter diazotrophicus PA1 5]|uniref:Uncharacterized protein n=2 Tax=Gluconacetobacter diazotrophicus TaxID=33996 RepID=A9H2T4_GLUDA|nr:hypothetical protein GDI0255 [Gluconacetobacter diazotrophicus PA1 5]
MTTEDTTMRHEPEQADRREDGDEKRHPAPGLGSPPEAVPDPDAETPPKPGNTPKDLPEPLTLPEHGG